MHISDAIKVLVKQVPDPSKGLPDEIFYYISRTTPLVNVDLLVKDEKGRTLLSWRDDQYAGTGWHVPGGIIRFKETMETRILEVARTELKIDRIDFDPIPVELNQLIHPTRDIRGHFISILFKCFLQGEFVPKNRGLSKSDRGYQEWHNGCPDNLLKVQEMYRKHIARTEERQGRK